MPKIMIDAGHYGSEYNAGAVKGYYESNMNWELQGYLKAALEAYGFIVGVTRTNKDTDIDVYTRGKLAKGYDLLLSLHSNASSSSAAKRVDVYKPLSGIGDDIAEIIAKTVFNCMNLSKDKNWYYETKTREGNGGLDYYGVIRGAVAVGVPGLIIEHSFHSNPEACKWLMSSANLKKLADAEAKVIAEYYGIKKPSATTTTTVMPKLSSGASGAAVKHLQLLLIYNGYTCGSSGIDGSYGPATVSAVKDFQKAAGLPVSGTCDDATWKAIVSHK